ncbi:erythromycin esterase family protein [Nonomuraea sp. NN258]|uniref:erythromycin esterase family protein n=1 Tax=Nonomuraea antri TaxID=2730852 RepID=UPI0015699BF9|nr:erythromycin esterase family protein [Nonomuraea antri]NRQ37308.1 erythromycin esterase family protein [Nonomuraea antri]
MATGIENLAHAVDAANLMKLLPSRPRVLALGEPAHREETLLDVRNQLFERLVEQEGYRTIAIESGCLAGLIVDDHVTSGAGDLDEVVARGITHGWGEMAGNRELVRWMRAYNDGRPAAEQVRFAGFDGPLETTHAESPRQALMALHTYLATWVDAPLLPCAAGTLDRLLGADERWTDQAAMMDPARSIGRSAEAGELRLLADDLVALLDAHTPHLVAASSRAAWDLARLHARTAVGLLRYHYWLADASPGRMSRIVGQRAAMMAGNLLALAERGPVLVHASNSHLQRHQSTMAMRDLVVAWWSAGALVHARLGADYAFVATALGTIRHHGVDDPPADTLEGLLSALPGDRHLFDARRLDAAFGDARPAARVSPWFGYAALNPAHLPGIDGLVFVKDALRD